MPTTLIHGLLRRVRRPLTRYTNQKALGRQMAFANQLLAYLARDGQVELLGTTPRIKHSLLTRSDVVVALVGDAASQAPRLVLKLPLTVDAERSTTTHRQVIMSLRQQPELQSFCACVPRAIAWGEYQGHPYYIETALPGTGANDLVRRHAEPAGMKQAAARLIGQLHTGTAKRRIVDDITFARLADDDIELLQRLAEHWPESALLQQKLHRLGELLNDQFYGRELPFSWTHGDFWPGNLLVEPDSGAISGVIDWDRAVPDQIPLLDLLHLLAYTRKMQRRTELGEEIVQYLLPAAFDQHEATLVRETIDALGLPADRAFFQAATLLYWLRFAAANLSRYPAFQHDQRWLKENVFQVLKRGIE